MTDITLSLAVQAVSFLVFFLVLRRVLFAPVLRHLEQRSQQLDELMERAQAQRQEATRLSERYADQIKAVRAEAQQLLDQAVREGESLRKELVAEARQESDRLLEEARHEIEAERQRALATFDQDLPDLAARAASRMLGRQVTREEAASVLDSSGQR